MIKYRVTAGDNRVFEFEANYYNTAGNFVHFFKNRKAHDKPNELVITFSAYTLIAIEEEK